MRYICYEKQPKPLSCLNPEVGAIAVTYLHGTDSPSDDCQLLKYRKKIKLDEWDTIYFVNFFPEEAIRTLLESGVCVRISTSAVEEYPGIIATKTNESFTVETVKLVDGELTRDDCTRGFDQLFFARKAPEMIAACRRSRAKHKYSLDQGINEYFNDGIDAVLKGVDFEGGIRAYADLLESINGGGNCFMPSVFVGTVGLMHAKGIDR
ncbi:hypothetical protein [Moorena sp. SIO3I8]|uniref:hypothetical protein n=1 Tax=Moorena sp. SIO3I8 TaxID=2607833 RepID=UPI0013C11FCF|nr:hypothetical protein [Moorena sp. SIO3I8]NEO08426.1 hypothetical protein [Moorena sp. SIO3I8]